MNPPNRHYRDESGAIGLGYGFLDVAQESPRSVIRVRRMVEATHGRLAVITCSSTSNCSFR